MSDIARRIHHRNVIRRSMTVAFISAILAYVTMWVVLGQLTVDLEWFTAERRLAVYTIAMGMSGFAIKAIGMIEPAGVVTIVPAHLQPLRRRASYLLMFGFAVLGTGSFNLLLAFTPFRGNWDVATLVGGAIGAITIIARRLSDQRPSHDPGQAAASL